MLHQRRRRRLKIKIKINAVSGKKYQSSTVVFQNLDDRLRLEQSLDRFETLRKPVSGDSPRFIFRHQQFFENMFFHQKIGFYKTLDFGGAVTL